MRRVMTESLLVRIHALMALNILTGIQQVDIAFCVNNIQFGHHQLKRLVPSTVITNAGQDKSLIGDLNMEWESVSMRVALSYDLLSSNPYAGGFCGGFWERLINNICLVLEPLRLPRHPPHP